MTESAPQSALSESATQPRLVLLTGHNAPVVSVAYSPDGSLLATGSYDGTVILWEHASGKMLRRISLGWHPDWLTFSPDGSTLATSHSFPGAQLWDVSTGAWRGTFPALAGPLAYEGDRLVGTDETGFVQIHAESGGLVRSIHVPELPDQYLSAREISADQSTGAVGLYHEGHVLQIWDLEAGSVRHSYTVPGTLYWQEPDPETGEWHRRFGAAAGISHLALTRDGAMLAVGDSFNIWLYDTREGRPTYLLQCGGPGPHALAFSPGGELLAAGRQDGSIRIWEAASGALRQEVRAHRSWVSGLAFSPDGEQLASTGHDRTVKIWVTATGESLRKLPGPEYDVQALSFSPDGETLVSGRDDGTLWMWRTHTGELLGNLETTHPQVRAVQFGPDGRLLASSAAVEYDGGGAVQIWEPGLRTVAYSLPFDAGLEPACLTPDGNLLASCATTQEQWTGAWQLPGGEPLYRIAGREAALTPDGTLLATTTSDWNDAVIQLWDARTGVPVRQFGPAVAPDGIVALRFSPDGRLLLAGFLGFGMGLWDVESGEQVRDLRTHADTISAIAFSPDGGTIAVGGSYDRQVVLWDTQTRKERLTLEGHGGNIRDVAFSPDGLRIASASADGTVKLWAPSSGQLLATLFVLPTLDGAADPEWITYTPDGYWTGSSGAAEFIAWDLAGEWLPAEAYAPTFRDPGTVAARLKA